MDLTLIRRNQPPAERPTLVAAASPVADEVRALVEAASGRVAGRYTFEDCHRRLAWHKRGLLVLVAADPDDRARVAHLARESLLRCSPLTVVAVEAGRGGEDLAS